MGQIKKLNGAAHPSDISRKVDELVDAVNGSTPDGSTIPAAVQAAIENLSPRIQALVKQAVAEAKAQG